MVKSKKSKQRKNSRLNTNSSIQIPEKPLSKTLTTKTSLTSKYRKDKKKTKIVKKHSKNKFCNHSKSKKHVSYIKNKKTVKFESFEEKLVYENLQKFEYMNKEKPDMDFDFDSDDELIESAIKEARKNLLKSLER